MAEVITKATRESFGMALCELAKTNKDIVVLDADLSAATKTSIFQKEFPERFINCGIAEANMIGVSAGLAATGKIPVAAS
ncbi:MAG: transketolase family protein, partial [Acutalibacteraceae bacterium]